MREESQNTTGIVISRLAKHEADAQVRVFTRDLGKVDLRVRGFFRPGSKLAGHLEPFNLCELLLLRGRNHDYIASAVNLDSFGRLKADLNKLYFAGRALALFDCLIKPEQEDQDLFELLLAFLSALDQSPVELTKDRGQLYFDFFLFKLLEVLGSAPDLSHCLIKQETIGTEEAYLDLEQGGLVCPACASKQAGDTLIKLKASTLELFRRAVSASFFQVETIVSPATALKQFSRTLKAFLEYHYPISDLSRRF